MIRSIHPLYLLGLLLTLLLTLIWQNSKVENEISHKLSERANANVMAKRIVELKKVMKVANSGQINAFLDGSLFTGAELVHRVKGERYLIDAKNMNARQLQSFLNRILNMNVKVIQMKMRNKDEKHVILSMEISL